MKWHIWGKGGKDDKVTPYHFPPWKSRAGHSNFSRLIMRKCFLSLSLSDSHLCHLSGMYSRHMVRFVSRSLNIKNSCSSLKILIKICFSLLLVLYLGLLFKENLLQKLTNNTTKHYLLDKMDLRNIYACNIYIVPMFR